MLKAYSYNTNQKHDWSIFVLQDLPKNVSRTMKIAHSATSTHFYIFCSTLVVVYTNDFYSQITFIVLFFPAFATEVFLLRHRKTSCGRSFSCPNCKALFGSIESLQTHCRRKGSDEIG